MDPTQTMAYWLNAGIATLTALAIIWPYRAVIVRHVPHIVVFGFLAWSGYESWTGNGEWVVMHYVEGAVYWSFGRGLSSIPKLFSAVKLGS